MPTYREVLGPAMKIADQIEADAYFEKIVTEAMATWGKSRADVEVIQRKNLGYYAGYYDNETMARVNRLFRTTHPIFGGTAPTPEEAFEMGLKIGASD